MSDGLLIARVGVSIGITAYFPDEGVSIGISITFSVDVFIIRGLSGGNYHGKKIGVGNQVFKSTEDRIAEKRKELSSLYGIWSDFLERNRNDSKLKYIRTMEELKEEILKVGKEQYRVRSIVENLIFDLDELMTNTRMSSIELEQCYILLSNAFQLIRDLSITFCLGEMSLRNSIDCSEEAEKVAEKWIAKGTDIAVINSIIQRREFSREIDRLTNIVIDKSNDYVEYSRTVKTIESEIKSLKERCERTKKYNSINDSLLHSENEISHLNSILETKSNRIKKYENEKQSIQAEIVNLGFMSFGKKKGLNQRLIEVETEIQKIRQEIDDSRRKLDNLKSKELDETQVNIINPLQNDINYKNDEMQKIKEKMNECESTVESLSSEIDELLKKYEVATKGLIETLD